MIEGDEDSDDNDVVDDDDNADGFVMIVILTMIKQPK